MAEIVNLRTARKRAQQWQRAERAAENRLVHGVPRGERKLEDQRRGKLSRELDQHRIDTGERR
jgi:hypothetical protein